MRVYRLTSSALRQGVRYCHLLRRNWRFSGHNRYGNKNTHYKKLESYYSLRLNEPRYFCHSSSSQHPEQLGIAVNAKNDTNSCDQRPLEVPNKCISIVDDDYHEIISRIPLQDVRNFCFIAHVDHGKSSLSSRLLEITGNMGRESQKVALESARYDAESNRIDDKCDEKKKAVDGKQNIEKRDVFKSNDDKEQIQQLDMLAVERERGITVKASAASMLYPHSSAVGSDGVLLLNCVDTPGHSDFSSEVSRSLLFVQGAVLLLDATQGIQAQSWTVHDKAKSMINPPELILATTKVDLDAARPIDVALTVAEWLSIDDPESIIPTSARSRIGIVPLLDAICWRVPPPQPMPDDNDNYTNGIDNNPILRVQVVDSWYDFRGVNCIIQVISGAIEEGDKICIATKARTTESSEQLPSMSTVSTQSFSVQEVGILLPRSHRTGKLRRGQMGYVRFGLKDPRQVDPGTTLIYHKDARKGIFIPCLNGSKTDHKFGGGSSAISVLYASVHPQEEDGFEELCDAIDRLALNDKGLEVTQTADIGGSDNSERGGPFLGPGVRVGFQGLLHVEVFRQRLLDEFGIEAVVTPPRVPYHVTLMPGKSNNLTKPVTKIVEDLQDWPEHGTAFKVEEPMVMVRLMAPVQYAGAVMELITKKRGISMETAIIDENSWMFEAQIPWAEVVINFHDMLKATTAGYGSLDTFEADPPLREAQLSKVEIFLNNQIVTPLSFICHSQNAQADARIVCKKLQEILPRQQFVTIIQAKANGKIISSERIKAFRKNVLVKSGKNVGGGDISRKKKLLEKQKQGKKRTQQSGKVTLSQAAFNSIISR